MNIRIPFSQIIGLLLLIMLVGVQQAHTQERFEPEVIPADTPRTFADVDYRNGIAFAIQLHNFGAGLGGQYRRVLGPLTEGIFEFHLTSLKDETEQSFNFFGQQIIPNKYSRVLTAPAMFGLKHRIFSEYLADNFRVFVQGVAGPAFTFVYPYYNDPQNLGYRTNQFPNDIFQGWGDGEITWGTAGHASLGIDFGNNFSRIQSVKFGYYFFYYPQGIQVMEPVSPVPNQSGADPIHLFGSPKISLVFGGMW
ncbi:MAG: hypothetical protein WD266_04235 [Balneolales bacterium]